MSGSPGMPMHSQGNDNSTTKATLTEGKITLNKDSTPTQTTAKALGINTELSQAHRAVEQPKDINQVLKEQQILSQAAGDVAGAVMTYVDNQKAELEKAKEKAREEAKAAEQAGDLITAERKRYEAQMLDRETARWETGGDNKRKATVVATALSLAVAGKPAEAIAAGAASPYINEAIKHITENTDNKALEALNIPLHILWGAVEAELAGRSAKAGAVAAGVGEIGARILAESVYGKQSSELTEEEKQNLLTTSKVLAGIAVASTNGGSGAETLANASVGMVVAENALENNAVNQKQAGTAEGFEKTLNSTKRKVGLAIGDEAEKYLLEFGESEYLKPTKTGFSNQIDDRYIYTENGGWIDMIHFIFYAGRAYRNKLNNQDEISKYLGFVPEGGAVESAISNKSRAESIALGYLQEASDTIFAPHSKFSYEDLPSDRFGAEFGSKYFSKDSPISLGEQIKSYLINELKATLPTKAPNYKELPKNDAQVHPGYYNFSTNPMYKGGK